MIATTGHRHPLAQASCLLGAAFLIVTLLGVSPGRAQAPMEDLKLFYSFELPAEGKTVQVREVKSTEPALLRPNIQLPLYLFLQETTDVERTVTVEVLRGTPRGFVPYLTTEIKTSKNRGVIKGWKSAATPATSPPATAPGATPGAPPPPPPPPQLEPPFQLEIRVLDKNKVLLTRTMNLDLLQPSEYFQRPTSTYDPAKRELRVEVGLKTREGDQDKPFYGPPCPVVLDLDHSPHPMLNQPVSKKGVKGFLQAQLSMQKPSAILRASNIPFRDARGDTEKKPDLIYISADGCDRAFVFRTNFQGAGTDYTNPDLRLQLDPVLKATTKLPVRILTDNVDWRTTRLRLRIEDPEVTPKGGETGFDEERNGPRERLLLLESPAPDGGLALQTVVRDWVVEVNTAGILDKLRLRAWLVEKDPDQPGKWRDLKQSDGKLVGDSQLIVLDPTPPTDAKFTIEGITDTKKRVKPGSTLKISAVATDEESGIKEIRFGLGKPSTDPKWLDESVVATLKSPKPGTTETPIWQAELALPPTLTGQVEVGMLAINKAGLSTPVSMKIDVLPPSAIAAAAKLGNIEVLVVEGDRPQDNLPVGLFDAKGKALKVEKSKDGKVVFKDVEPGAYTITSAKEASSTKGSVEVKLKEGETAKVTVKLFR